MISYLKDYLENSYTVQLTENHHQIAHKFASLQQNSTKSKQAEFNTLAILSVNDMLPEFTTNSRYNDDSNTVINWLIKIGYTQVINLKDSESLKPLATFFQDTGHLKVAGIDVNLECRPVLPDDEGVIVPEEVLNNRDFYLGVKFQEVLDKVELLGFCSADEIKHIPVEEDGTITIPFEQLHPIEGLIDELFAVEIAQDEEEKPPVVNNDNDKAIQIIQQNQQILTMIEKMLPNVTLFDIVNTVQPIYQANNIQKFQRDSEGGKALKNLGDNSGNSQEKSPPPIATRKDRNDILSSNISPKDSDKSWERLAKNLFRILGKLWDEEKPLKDAHPENPSVEVTNFSIPSVINHPEETTIPQAFNNITRFRINPTNEIPLGWQDGKRLLSDRQFARFRSGKSGKQENETFDSNAIYKTIKLGDEILEFIVQITPTSPNQADITLGILPNNPNDRLPNNLLLSILDEHDNLCMSEDNEPIQATPMDSRVKLEFYVEQGEKFKVKITLDNLSITENFIIENL